MNNATALLRARVEAILGCSVEDATLVACESSGMIRDALITEGVPAISCDLKGSERPGPHWQGDALELLALPWRGLIAHPVCKFLANSGSKHLYKGMKKANGPNPTRWAKMADGAAFFNAFEERARHIPFRARENPIVHRHAKALMGKQSQVMQPWHHGEPFFKAICWWLFGLPNVPDTNRLNPPKPGTPEHKQWSAVHREKPGPDREANRSRTLPGVARGIALAWAPYLRPCHKSWVSNESGPAYVTCGEPA